MRADENGSRGGTVVAAVSLFAGLGFGVLESFSNQKWRNLLNEALSRYNAGLRPSALGTNNGTTTSPSAP